MPSSSLTLPAPASTSSSTGVRFTSEPPHPSPPGWSSGRTSLPPQDSSAAWSRVCQLNTPHTSSWMKVNESRNVVPAAAPSSPASS